MKKYTFQKIPKTVNKGNPKVKVCKKNPVAETEQL